METLQTQETTLAGQRGQLEEAKAAIIVLQKDKKKAIDTFIAENQQKLSEAERQADELEQKTLKAHVKTEHMTLTAPISGIVLGLTVTTKNQVLQSGEEIMRIVPDDASLEMEAYVENKDIGFVKVGQDAIIKVESFPFTRFGTIDAVVTHVSLDAIPEPDATTAEGMPTKSKKDSFFGGAQRTQNLVFQVILKAKQDYMDVEGVKIPLSSGMAITAEIKTGKRRIIEYIFSPLVEVTSRAMKER
jgi:hemolysin D